MAFWLVGSTQSPAFWHFFQVDKAIVFKAHEAPLWGVVATGNIAKLAEKWECESAWDLLPHCLLSVAATEMF